jgi:Uma2 family endonuclease
MGEAALKQEWTLETFLVWERDQPERWEFVDGQPRAMTGGSEAHDTIGGNIRAFLKFKLKGSDYRAQGPDLKILTGLETSRYPDALINCAPPDPKGDIAQNPVVVFEVLSDSTKAKDFNEKFDEYEATPAIRQYVLVFQDEIRVKVYRREGGALLLDRVSTNLEDRIDLTVGASLSMSEIYDDITLAMKDQTARP